MPYKKIKLQDLKLDTRRKKLKELAGKEYLKIHKFIEEVKNGEHNKGIDICEQTERRYIDVFAMAYKNIKKKQLSQLDKKDLTELKQDLKKGKIKSRFKKPYSDSTQRDMELILINFLDWLNPKKYAGFKKWFVIKVPKKTVEYLKESEIEKLYKSCKTNAERFLICVLFDGGLRASEFLNIRFEDVIEPTQSFPYYKIDIKREYSKTEPRTIGLYWKHSTEAVRDYISELDNFDLKKPVYQKDYNAVRMFITRLGKRILNKRVHFHIFRKSSASYYAVKLKSRQQLCYRYGWKFSSDIPDVYISREMGEDEVKDVQVNISMQKLEKENQELKTRLALIQDQIDKEIEERKNMKMLPMADLINKQMKTMEKNLNQKFKKQLEEERKKNKK